ncbi:MAG: monophosphatase [Sphingomonadales bacterium]|nr:monophosphatase [Sphingomonadales bacterium]
MDDAARLETAIRAAREGGRVALAHVRNPLYFKVKDRRDLLVGASVVVQDTIRDILLGAYPDDGFLGEDGPDDEELPVNADRLWIVDPIDGSTNFFRGLPHFAISIGFRDAFGFRIGVVYDPSRDELFSARFADGARLNGERIYVHVPGEGEDAYESSLIGTDLPGSTEGRVDGLRAAMHVGNRMLGLVMMGAPALGLCYVAAGRTHAYFHLKLHLWDVAAAAVILQESGAILTNGTGGSWLYSDGSYLATNARLHGGMLRLLRAALPEGL